MPTRGSEATRAETRNRRLFGRNMQHTIMDVDRYLEVGVGGGGWASIFTLLDIIFGAK